MEWIGLVIVRELEFEIQGGRLSAPLETSFDAPLQVRLNTIQIGLMIVIPHTTLSTRLLM